MYYHFDIQKIYIFVIMKPIATQDTKGQEYVIKDTTYPRYSDA